MPMGCVCKMSSFLLYTCHKIWRHENIRRKVSWIVLKLYCVTCIGLMFYRISLVQCINNISVIETGENTNAKTDL